MTGGSGGGVLTAWIVGHTDRFRAAVVVKPVINWTSFVLTADMTNYFYRYWFDVYPWDDLQAYWKRSPLAYVGNVHTPTMLMTGEVDYRTPSSEAEQFYEALKLRKVDTALVRVPNASHDISARPSLLIAKVSLRPRLASRPRRAAVGGCLSVRALGDRGCRLTEENPSLLIGHGRGIAEICGERISVHGGRPRGDLLEPALQVGEILEILTLRLVRHHPGIGRHVGDGVLARRRTRDRRAACSAPRTSGWSP